MAHSGEYHCSVVMLASSVTCMTVKTSVDYYREIYSLHCIVLLLFFFLFKVTSYAKPLVNRMHYTNIKVTLKIFNPCIRLKMQHCFHKYRDRQLENYFKSANHDYINTLVALDQRCSMGMDSAFQEAARSTIVFILIR